MKRFAVVWLGFAAACRSASTGPDAVPSNAAEAIEVALTAPASIVGTRTTGSICANHPRQTCVLCTIATDATASTAHVATVGAEWLDGEDRVQFSSGALLTTALTKDVLVQRWHGSGMTSAQVLHTETNFTIGGAAGAVITQVVRYRTGPRAELRPTSVTTDCK